MHQPQENTAIAVDDRLNDLEMKLAFQEQLVQELNDALTAESARVTELDRRLDELRQRLAAQSSGDDPELPEPPPPHY